MQPTDDTFEYISLVAKYPGYGFSTFKWDLWSLWHKMGKAFQKKSYQACNIM